MDTPMTTPELWLAAVLALLSFGGLWRSTTELAVLGRSGLPIPDRMEVPQLFRLMRLVQIAALLSLAFAVLALAGIFQPTRIFWLMVGGTVVYSLWLAGRGRAVLGPTTPGWVRARGLGDDDDFGDSISRVPTSPNAEASRLFVAGGDEELRGRLDAAMSLYRQALERDPRFVKCLTAKGILHCRKRELDEGIRLFEQAAQLAPQCAWALHMLAQAERQAGRRQEATAHEQQARRNLDRERATELLRTR